MAGDSSRSKRLLAIVGETASGKSALAMQLAREFDGEIICADSRTVYAGMDLGTAKPAAADQTAVPHHCLDITTPDKPISAADFKRLAEQAIADIQARGRLPLLVGGTGLYVDAVLYNFAFRRPADPGLRAALNQLSVEQLQERIKEQGIALPKNKQNPRHLIRALETGGAAASKNPLRPGTLIIGLKTEHETLQKRVAERVDHMFADGFIDEARALFSRYPADLEAFKTPGYLAAKAYLEGAISLEMAKQEFIKADLALAKRQRTWFKRNKSIHWFQTPVEYTEVAALVRAFLNT